MWRKRGREKKGRKEEKKDSPEPPGGFNEITSQKD